VLNGRKAEGVFIETKSSGRPVLRANIRYYSTVVQRLFRTTRYYLVDFVNNARTFGTLAYICRTVHRIQLYYLLERTSSGGPPYVHAKRL
jgi:hypothetical protein